MTICSLRKRYCIIEKHKEKKFIIPLLRDNNNLMFRCLIIFMCTCLFKNRTGKKPGIKSRGVCVCALNSEFSYLSHTDNIIYLAVCRVNELLPVPVVHKVQVALLLLKTLVPFLPCQSPGCPAPTPLESRLWNVCFRYGF